MVSRSIRLKAILFAFIMLASMPAMGVTAAGTGGGAGPPDSVTTDVTAPPAPTDVATGVSNPPDVSELDDSTTRTVDPALRDADGVVELVVRIEPPGAGTLDADGDTVGTLRDHAEATQRPIVDFAEATEGVETQNTFWVVNAVVLEVDTDRIDLDAIAALDGVDRIHSNFEVTTPEPPETAEEEDTTTESSDPDVTYGLDQVNAPDVWDDYDTMGEGVDVAVLDTGVDPDHDDIDIDPENFAEFDTDGSQIDDPTLRDTSNHGTHVSGTVVGGNASGQYIGVAPEATLMHGLVLPGGSGSFTQVAAGIEWAVEEDADVASMSLGATGYFDEMIEPVRNAEAAGTLVVASAGNDGEGTSGSPGNVYESFSVGATDEFESVTGFSSGERIDTEAAWGDAAPTDWPDEYVVPDISAPGSFVLSAVPGNDYDSLSGTSMAAPHVSGSIALALSAADGERTPPETKDAFERIAFTPDGEPTEQDVRYGHGIVDARLTTEFLGANQGINGTVTDTDGDPIPDETIRIDQRGFAVDTDADGTYLIRADADEYELETDVFGYTDETRHVTVDDGAFRTETFALSETLDLELLRDQPDTVVAGDVVDLEIRAANLDTLTVDITGSYDSADASLHVDGEPVEWGEPVAFDGADDQTVSLTVETASDVAGMFELEHTFEGLNETVELTTGPTEVAEDAVEVGVVEGGGADGDVLVDELETNLPGDHLITRIAPADAVDAAQSDDFDTLVVLNLPDDPDAVRAFREATRTGDVGAVHLDTWRYASGISALHEATGTPPVWEGEPVSISAIGYRVQQEHPIVDGLGDPEEFIEIIENDLTLHGMDWFDGYQGDVVALAEDGFDGVRGQGLGVNDAERTVLASSLAPALGSGPRTDAAGELVANAVEHTSESTGATIQQPQPDHLEPDVGFDEVEMQVTYAVEDLQEYEVSPADENTIDTEHIDLEVNGNVAAFGQTLAYDDLTDEQFTVTFRIDADQTGVLAFDHEFATGTGDDQRTVSGTTGPTPMYQAPLNVPDDAADLNEAGDMLVDGVDVALGNGTHGGQLYVPPFVSDIDVYGVEDADATLGPAQYFLERLGDDQAAIYLDSTIGADGVESVSDRVGNPGAYDDLGTTLESGGTELHIESDHPIFDGVGSDGDVVEYTSTETDHPSWGVPVSFRAWFDDYSGETLGSVANAGDDPDGAAIGVDDDRNQILLSSSARSGGIGPRHDLFTDAENEILLNSVEYAAQEQADVDGTVDIAVVGEAVEIDEETADEMLREFGFDEAEIEDTLDDADPQEINELTAFLRDELDDETFEVHNIHPSDLMDALGHDVYLVQDYIELEDETAAWEPGVVHSESPSTTLSDLAVDADNRTSAVRISGDNPTVTDVEVHNTDLIDGFDGYEEYDGSSNAPDPFDFDDYGYGVNLQFAEDPEFDDVEAVNTDIGLLVSNPGEMEHVELSGVSVSDSNAGVYLHDLFLVEDAGTVTDNEIENTDVGVVLGCGTGGTHVADNEVTGAEIGVSVGDICGGPEDLVVEHNHVVDSDYGFAALQFAEDNVIQENTVESSETGFLFDGGSLIDSTTTTVGGQTVVNNTFDATTAVELQGQYDWQAGIITPPETPVDIEASTIQYNDVTAAETAVHVPDEAADVLQEERVTDLRVNWWGSHGPANVAFESPHLYEPFLTVPPDETAIDPDGDTGIGVDFEVAAGDTTALGVPGPTDQTVSEMFAEPFDGVVYAFDEDEDRWTQVTGDYSPSALEALVVVAAEDATGTMSFETGDAAAPGERSIEEGWNFVAAPTSQGIHDAFGVGSTSFSVAQFVHDRPHAQFTPSGELDGAYVFDDGTNPTVSPFEGYFLFAEEDGLLAGHLHSNPTVDQLYDTLQVEPEPHPGSADAAGEHPHGETTVTIEDLATIVDDGVDVDDETLARLATDALEHELHDESVTTQTAGITIVDSATNDVLAAAPEDDQQAVADAFETAYDRLFTEDGELRKIGPETGDDPETQRLPVIEPVP